MSESVYNFASNLVDFSDLRGRIFESKNIVDIAQKKVWTKVSKAIYVVIDDEGFVSYVGSVDRESSSGLAGRITEHSRIADRERWDAMMIFPLEESVEHSKVLYYEGAIARYLKPYDSKKSPRL